MTNEIASLPDNYAQAESTHSPTNLPHGLFQTNSDWVIVLIPAADLIPKIESHDRRRGKQPAC